MTGEPAAGGSAAGPGGVVAGIDVGGTFTDVCILDERTGEIGVSKSPSTRGREADGFLRGLLGGLDRAGAEGGLAAAAVIVHGTTVGTNALLERKLAPVGLITTEGFRDVLEMRRRDRPRTWGLWGDFEPVVPRDRRLEVAERVLADGTVLVAVDPGEAAERARALLEAGAEACCVAFLNAYANPVNEQTALEAVRAVWPNGHVTAASDILPEIREFERISTVALNAGLQPVVGGYLADLEAALADRGFAGRFFLIQSNGGVMTAAAARALPVRTALGGPAAGVIACAELARAAGYDDVITCDMGGTSFDVAVVSAGRTVTSPQAAIDFGLVIRTPMIEITTIGAGGGSIARVDAGGRLRVGPESAGSAPGPACYGAGGDRPTVTDAHLVLGRINGESPIGGLDPLDAAAARAAVAEGVAGPLGLGVEEAAEAVVEVATSSMAGAIRLVSVERGLDPARFAAMTFGGAGALHACKLVAEVGLRGAVIPRHPGVVSAYGCLIADFGHDLVQTVNLDVASIDSGRLSERLRSAEERTLGFLAGTGLALEEPSVRHEFDMAYAGQTHTIAVDASDLGDRELGPEAVQAAFDRAYAAAYGRTLDGVAARLLSVRTTVVGRRPRIDPRTFAPPSAAAPGRAGAGQGAGRGRTRPVYSGGSWADVAVVDRLGMAAGETVTGPAVLEQPDATIVVEPGFTGRVDALGNLVLERVGQ